MAEFLQSEVKIIHAVEGGKPTDTDKETEVDKTDGTEEKEQPQDKIGAKGVKRLGKGSVIRRMGNIIISSGENIVDRNLQEQMYAESFSGNKHKMVAIQNKRLQMKNRANFAKGLTSGLVSSVILQNPYILALWGVTEAINKGDTIRNNYLENERQREREDREVYIAQRRQQRLIVGTYNRR